MLVTGLFSFFFRFTLLCMGAGAASGVNRGEWRAGVILLGVIALWNWRWILDYVAERRWRY
jgi:hypothetical protein